MAEGGRWALIVHGGAKEMKPEEESQSREGILEALDAGRRILESGGAAIDAVEESVRVLEDLPVFNAAIGSSLNERGEVEMSAGIMEGAHRRIGCIAYVSTLRHPISVARKLLDEKWVLLVGEGATRFAEAKGAEFCAMEELITDEGRRALKQAKDTVGAVALDGGGNLAVATATGGLAGAAVGRVSDTAMPACGFYADNHIGAVAFSGDGESIARLALASQVMASIARDGPEAAIRKAVDQLPHVGGAEGDGGGIAIRKDGTIGWDHNSPHFVVGYASAEDPQPRAFVKKNEEHDG